LLARYARRGGPAGAWTRLPATRAEVEAIARQEGAGKDDVVTDALASERVVKTASELGVLGRKRHLHLATHGILGVGLGRQPSLVLSLVGNDGTLQLGGANDGFLTLEEVTHLRLNADLVVLSACETGKGDLKPAEGVMGLARAFLHAGSRGVVCSLWSVDDERTSTLMQALYGKLKEGKPAAEALALARRQLIAQEQAPFYWAPFILIGR
jgi:CHAT domain-containing protein